MEERTMTPLNEMHESKYVGNWSFNGREISQAPNSAVAMKEAGLDWDVVKVPAYGKLSDGTMVPALDRFTTVRTDTNEVLGIVGKQYQPVQNRDAFGFLDFLIEDGSLKYTNAGTLRGGLYVWMMAEFPEEFAITSDDKVRNSVFLFNAHDGSKTMRSFLSNIRLHCMNQLPYLFKGDDEQFIMRHTANVVENSRDRAQEFFGFLEAKQNSLNAMLKGLAQTDVNENQVTKFVEEMFPQPVYDNAEQEKEISTRLLNTRQTILGNFDAMSTEATSGTAYGLLNALTEYTDHQRSSRGNNVAEKMQSRFDSVILGSGMNLKKKALEVLSNLS